MSYYAKPNFIEYDEWFDSNINPFDLTTYSKNNNYTKFIHEKFYQISIRNLNIGSSNNLM